MGPELCVRSALKWSTKRRKDTQEPTLGVRFTKISDKRELTVVLKVFQIILNVTHQPEKDKHARSKET